MSDCWLVICIIRISFNFPCAQLSPVSNLQNARRLYQYIPVILLSYRSLNWALICRMKHLSIQSLCAGDESESRCQLPLQTGPFSVSFPLNEHCSQFLLFIVWLMAKLKILLEKWVICIQIRGRESITSKCVSYEYPCRWGRGHSV